MISKDKWITWDVEDTLLVTVKFSGVEELWAVSMITAMFSVWDQAVSLHFYHWNWQCTPGLAAGGENSCLTQASPWDCIVTQAVTVQKSCFKWCGLGERWAFLALPFVLWKWATEGCWGERLTMCAGALWKWWEYSGLHEVTFSALWSKSYLSSGGNDSLKHLWWKNQNSGKFHESVNDLESVFVYMPILPCNGASLDMFRWFIDQAIFKVHCMKERVSKNTVWWPQPMTPWFRVVSIKILLSKS